MFFYKKRIGGKRPALPAETDSAAEGLPLGRDESEGKIS
jgi:hypothetical protein